MFNPGKMGGCTTRSLALGSALVGSLVLAVLRWHESNTYIVCVTLLHWRRPGINVGIHVAPTIQRWPGEWHLEPSMVMSLYPICGSSSGPPAPRLETSFAVAHCSYGFVHNWLVTLLMMIMASMFGGSICGYPLSSTLSSVGIPIINHYKPPSTTRSLLAFHITSADFKSSEAFRPLARQLKLMVLWWHGNENI